jgi:cyclopropane fatty-acyl-phospholipid synthase-like methyltransferase
MCTVSALQFFMESTKPTEFNSKKILEVGSRYVNGSIRPLIENFSSPAKYIGVDISPGKMVDEILPAEKVLEHFGAESFDVIISTELLEHVMDWRVVINGLKATLKRGGCLYLTTRSFGLGYHGYPFDFWRFEIKDMEQIFSDFEIMTLQKDSECPGVFIKAKKPDKFAAADLSGIALFSMVLGKRTKEIVSISSMPLGRKFSIKLAGIARRMARNIHLI